MTRDNKQFYSSDVQFTSIASLGCSCCGSVTSSVSAFAFSPSRMYITLLHLVQKVSLYLAARVRGKKLTESALLREDPRARHQPIPLRSAVEYSCMSLST